MRKAIVFCIAAFIVASSAVTAAKMPKGSFLMSPVSNVEQLAKQVTDDPIVAARYAKCFSMSRNLVVDYFEKNLRIGRLRSDFETTIYVVSEKVDLSTTTKVLQKGSYVFVAPDGQPLLEGRTGNPLLDYLPLPMKVGAAVSSGTGAAGPVDATAVAGSGPAAVDNVVTKVLSSNPVEIGTAATVLPVGEVAPLAVVGGAASLESVVDIVASMPVGATGAAFGVPGIGVILPLAAVVGGAALVGAGGGGSDSTSSQAPVDTQIPEPATMTMLAIGASALALRLRRRRR
ncbi:MAG: PEP-CTERM sorting domain-containing protein [Armatimonadetes bacterium]|nr:PEP-CTERM sorting domain-containing protein [Armatimonadota bacterium]